MDKLTKKRMSFAYIEHEREARERSPSYDAETRALNRVTKRRRYGSRMVKNYFRRSEKEKLTPVLLERYSREFIKLMKKLAEMK
jgi:hypothetical protein